MCDLVDRLLTKRCVSYFGRNENYLLATGERGQGDFSTIGTDAEQAPLVMENCLTRDEMKLTGFLLISSKVTKVVREKSFSTVSIGIPFPCLTQEGLWDWQELMVTRRQNIAEKGYGPKGDESSNDVSTELLHTMKMRSIWGNLYGHKLTLFSTMDRKSRRRFDGGSREKEEDRLPRYVKLPRMTFLDVRQLALRLSVITIGILAEANKRAALENKMALIVLDKNSKYLHFQLVNGLVLKIIQQISEIGLGSCHPIYETVFLRNFTFELLCMYRYLNNIYGVKLIEFKETVGLKDGSKMYLGDGVFGNRHPNEGIEISYIGRDDWKLEDVPARYLVVETYRLDVNAMPGNELWLGSVKKQYSEPSFDVRNTAIPFIHNPLINKTRLCGRNLQTCSTYGEAEWKYVHYVNN